MPPCQLVLVLLGLRHRAVGVDVETNQGADLLVEDGDYAVVGAADAVDPGWDDVLNDR